MAPADAKNDANNDEPNAASGAVRETAGGALVHRFGHAELPPGGPVLRELLGVKGAGLHEMVRLGLPVPPGFTVTTQVCGFFQGHDRAYPEGLEHEVVAAMATLENELGLVFGDAHRPLLVSVRSGARASMPGMMDTVLNLGLNEATVAGLADRTKDPRFAWDSYRRFIQMYGDVVLGIRASAGNGDDAFERLLEQKRRSRGVRSDQELTADDLRDLCSEFKREIAARTGAAFPEDPWPQLWGAIGAAFGSWMSPRAVNYRRLYGLPDSWGTAVSVQAMVFGNMGEHSCTGVAFTRDPSTGTRSLHGEFLVNAQGQDVMTSVRAAAPLEELPRRLPDAFDELVRVQTLLEQHYRDAQHIEFTVEENRLYLLRTRTAKRTARAAVKIAVDLCNEGLISRPEAILRIDATALDQLLHPTLDPKHNQKPIARGLAASPGAVSGKVVFSADDAETWASRGERVILVRVETSPEDINGMKVADGILTARGGMTSHAAVVARGMGKCCVAGSGEIHVDYKAKEFIARNQVVRQGEVITLDGGSGLVFLGDVPKVAVSPSQEFDTLMAWADGLRRLRVRANADTPDDAITAKRFGAEGIGLCRTEHMFFSHDRVAAVREMILADDPAARRKALERILPMQRQDFVAIFRVMDGQPVTIRLLDPPLHEFLPQRESEIRELARGMDVTEEKLWARKERLDEFNPMLGHRGCRLGISYPEIYQTQVRAIVEAACDVAAQGIDVRPEIEIPLVSHERELMRLRAQAEEVIGEVLRARGQKIAIKIGTMIELPRACIMADRIAQSADFFSFGTNDLTQTTYGLSRDDAGRFLPEYVEKRIFDSDPFSVLDADGVGALMKLALERGRQTKPGLEVGICGEHGGEPRSVELCHRLGLDYVSCSPFRVPVARLAAAQAVCRKVDGRG